MFQRPKRKQSMKSRLLLNSLILSFTTGVVLIGAILCSGVLLRLDKTASRNLSRVVETRSHDMNELFLSLTTNALSVKTELEKKVNQAYSEQNSTISDMLANNPQEAFSILNYGTESLLNTLQYNAATDIFIALDRSAYETEGRENSRAAIYMRSENTIGSYMYAQNNKQGLLLLKGRPIEGVLLDNYWSEEWVFNNDIEMPVEFFDKPYNAAKNYKHLSGLELGYFSPPVSAVNDNIRIVYYTLPLVDIHGEPYGVVGLGLSEEFLKRELQFHELSYYNNAFYMLSRIEDGFIDRNHIVSGYFAIQHFENDGSVRLVNEFADSYGEYIFMLESSNSDSNPTIATVNELNLYYRNSPFYDEKWYVIGAVKRADVFESSHFLLNLLVVDILITIVVGIILTFYLVRNIISKITKLTGSVNSMNNEYKISLQRTGIVEFDLLADSIEGLSAQLLNTANVMMNTIKLTGSSIGIFEIDEEKSRVFMTELIFDLFGLPFSEGEYYISTEKWEENYVKLFLTDIGSEDNVFETNDNRWFQIKREMVNGKECGIVFDITQDVIEKKKLAHERDYDFLTGLLNRGAFKERCSKILQSKRPGLGVMIFIDLDNLKFFNDTYGHECGDLYIRSAARVFEQLNDYGALVSRYSGDEFVIFMSNLSSKDEALQTMRDCLQNKELLYFKLKGGQTHKVRYSLGYAWYPDDSDTYSQLVKYADFAMYEIKHTDKGGWKEFDKDSYEINAYLLDKSESLNRLLDNEMLTYMFQPIVNLKTGEVLGYEALMRSSIGDFKSVTHIITLAKFQAKLYKLESLTYNNVMRWVKANMHRLDGRLIFFNSISNQKLSDEDMKDLDERYYDCYRHTVVEITKNERDSDGYFKLKEEDIHVKGGKIAIDDYKDLGENPEHFGTKPDFIKISRDIISDIHNSATKQRVLSDILKHYKDTNIKIIAVGVETSDDLKYVISAGIDFAQGFYLSHPLKDISEIPEDKKNEILKYAT